VSIVYITGASNNYGDLLNIDLFNHLLGEVVYESVLDIWESHQPQYVGVGTLIDFIAPAENFLRTKLIFLGTGAAHFDKKVDLSHQGGWVRGKRSSCKTDLPYIGDPALLIDRVYGKVNRQERVCVILDWIKEDIPNCLGLPAVRYCADPISYYEVPLVFSKIAKSAYVITDRLHVAVTAESLGIPWLLYAHNDRLRDKFLDWAEPLDKSEFVVSKIVPELLRENVDFTKSSIQKRRMLKELNKLRKGRLKDKQYLGAL